MPSLELKSLPAPQRTLAAAFLISLGLAYAVALLFVFVKSDLTAPGIAAQFRGSGEAAAGPAARDTDGDEAEDAVPALGREWSARKQGMQFPKPLKEMILTTHLHMLSISMVFLLVGALFSLSSFPAWAKAPVLASGFLFLVFTYAAMWAVRYAGPGFSVPVFLGGLGQSLSMTLQILWSLRDLLAGAWKKTPALSTS